MVPKFRDVALSLAFVAGAVGAVGAIGAVAAASVTMNVAPRNVFNVWQLASAGVIERVQPMPPTVTALLP